MTMLAGFQRNELDVLSLLQEINFDRSLTLRGQVLAEPYQSTPGHRRPRPMPVILDVLTVIRPLPLYPGNRTSSVPVGRSEKYRSSAKCYFSILEHKKKDRLTAVSPNSTSCCLNQAARLNASRAA
jgi:hypothetical protein